MARQERVRETRKARREEGDPTADVVMDVGDGVVGVDVVVDVVVVVVVASRMPRRNLPRSMLRTSSP